MSLDPLYPYRDQNRGYSATFLAEQCVACRHPRGAHRNRSDQCFECAECHSFSKDGGLLPAIRERLEASRRRASRVAARATRPEIRVQRPEVRIARGTEAEAQRCPFCHDGNFEREPSLRCQSCKAWQHVACVDESRRRRCGACRHEFPSR